MAVSTAAKPELNRPGAGLSMMASREVEKSEKRSSAGNGLFVWQTLGELDMVQPKQKTVISHAFSGTVRRFLTKCSPNEKIACGSVYAAGASTGEVDCSRTETG